MTDIKIDTAPRRSRNNKRQQWRAKRSQSAPPKVEVRVAAPRGGQQVQRFQPARARGGKRSRISIGKHRTDGPEPSRMPTAQAELQKWIENHYSLEEPFILPREQLAHVQVHNWKFTQDLGKLADLASLDTLALKLEPSVNRFLSIGVPATESIVKSEENGGTETTTYNAFESGDILKGITFDEDMVLTNGKKLKPGLTNFAGYKYEQAGDLKAGCKMYSGALPSWDGRIEHTFTNTDNADMVVETFMLREAFDGTLTEFVNGSTTNVPGNGIANAVDGYDPSNFTDCRSFGFGFRIQNSSSIGRVPRNFSWKCGFYTNTIVANALQWRDFKVWDILQDPSGTLRNQYENSDFHCFTAMHATVSNTQTEILKGGSLQVAQLNGNTTQKLPHTWEGLDSFLGNRLYNTNESKVLGKGFHWNYQWEKVQDTFFITRDAEGQEDSLRPYCVATMKVPSNTSTVAAGAGFSLLLSGKVQIEYITELRDAAVYLTPADTCNLLARYCAIKSSMPCIFENPSHLKGIAQNVKKIMTHPVTKEIVKSVAMTGLKLLL